MAQKPLNDLDRRILHHLQTDARGQSDTDIARQTDVTSATIGTRIEDLEQRGIVRGYYPDIDYAKAGYPLVTLFVSTVPVGDRATIAERALDVRGVVSVREILGGEQNLHVTAVADSPGRAERIAEGLARLGLHIVRSDVVLNHARRPWDHHHVATQTEDDDADISEDVQDGDADGADAAREEDEADETQLEI